MLWFLISCLGKGSMIQVGVKKNPGKKINGQEGIPLLGSLFSCLGKGSMIQVGVKKPGKKIKGQEDIPLLGSLFSCLGKGSMIQVGVKKTRQKDKRTRRYSAAWFLIFLPLIFLPGKRFDDSSWSKKNQAKR
jgi:alpha-tubulin suppressor-like RCC1 family protein